MNINIIRRLELTGHQEKGDEVQGHHKKITGKFKTHDTVFEK